MQTSNVNISTATLRANAASVGGSVYCFNRCNSTILNTTFLNNTAGTRGGGIDVQDDSELTLLNSTLVGKFTFILYYIKDVGKFPCSLTTTCRQQWRILWRRCLCVQQLNSRTNECTVFQ